MYLKKIIFLTSSIYIIADQYHTKHFFQIYFKIPEQIKTINPVTVRPKRPVSPIRPPSRPSGPLKCFSCGSLLSQVSNCTEFNPSNPAQVQTCGTNEACLLYTYKKSEGICTRNLKCFFGLFTFHLYRLFTFAHFRRNCRFERMFSQICGFGTYR